MVLAIEHKPMISLTKGRAKLFTANVSDPSGIITSLTGATVLFTVKTDYGSQGATVFTKTLTGVEAGASFSTGVVAIQVNAGDTSGFSGPADGKEFQDLVWDMKVTVSGSPIGSLVDFSRTGKLRLYQALG